MTFVIDTGYSGPDAAAGWRFDRSSVLMNGALDALPADATQAQIDAAVLAHVIGEIYRPKVMTTVRAALCRFWPLLCDIALRDPTAFDEVIVAYAELTTTLPADRSEAIGRHKASAGNR